MVCGRTEDGVAERSLGIAAQITKALNSVVLHDFYFRKGAAETIHSLCSDIIEHTVISQCEMWVDEA
jgi:hypothetical protein